MTNKCTHETEHLAKQSLGILAIVLVLQLGTTITSGRPRDPLPPYPESKLFSESFDQAFYFFGARSAPTEVPELDLVESWSGYCLRRQGTSVIPFVIPGVQTNGRPSIQIDQGMIRFWFQPSRIPPGDYAVLLQLTATEKNSLIPAWTIGLDPAGTTLYWSGQNQEGQSVDFLKANLNWKADGSWHLVNCSFTSSNTLLAIDGVVSAVGEPFPIPAVSATNLMLSFGSSADGRFPSQGFFDEISIFDKPWQSRWDVAYYEALVNAVCKGPITQAEDEAVQQARLARRATLGEGITATQDGGGYMLLSGETNGLWLSPPLIVGTNISLTLWNADTNKSYDIYYSAALQTNMVWSYIAVRGQQGQTNFANFSTTTLLGPIGFFRAYEGDDWDWDGCPNYMDAQPYNSAVSNLTITIESPLNGSNID